MNRRSFNLNLLGAAAGAALPKSQTASKLRVKGERLNRNLAELALFGKTPEGGTHRVAYTEEDRLGRDYAMRLMREAGLEVGIDAAGNLIGRRTGRKADLPVLAIGSHIDSVPQGGRFDGQVGSMGAIEVAQTLAENNVTLNHPLEVIIFANEEGGTYGSHAMAHGLTEKQLGLTTNSGKTVGEGIRFIGGNPDKLGQPLRKRGEIAAYLELHIEQGGILDAEKINIGVVEGIVGINQWEVTVDGFANHAGTTPMNQRHDALLSAAKYIEAVNRVVTSIPGRQVGTVGKIQAYPGAYNVIPGKVSTTLELRDLDATKIQNLFQKIQAEVAQIEKSNRTKFTFKETNTIVPAPTDTRVRELIDETAKQLNLTTKLMPSGAGHDAQEIAPIAPVGMIFVPSRNGISHSPHEYSSPQDIANGANVLLQTLLRLDEN
ncbi:MAG TPA: Zn-dependent hydrolase [Blastocatellia bacterium]|nr:Zn-dependent hydrolase [Blastocatellia bacterium]HMZ22498.1 Zn-dependent hydrolase [Blastocatellia bacterium]HNG31038.1 Zn-dependent hydrolase [Blastocatellia bacterium]